MPHIEHYPTREQPEPEVQLSERPTIHPSCVIRDSYVGAWTELMANSMLVESTFDDYSYTAGDVDIIYTDVGKFCSIASHVRINPSNHAMWRVTQHHMTYRRRRFGLASEDDVEFFDWRRLNRCRIGHDVWLGHGAVVMPGVQIGHGAVVGSGAVVTKDVPPYQIVAGVPAKAIRQRFPDKIIEQLLKIAWWDWDRATLEQRFDELLDTESFVARHASTLA